MSKRVLVVSANWLGDCVMSMPALLAFRASHPEDRIALLARPQLAPLWRMHPAADEIVEYEPNAAGSLAAGRRLRGAYDAAYLLPNSFRTALIVRLGGVPERIGARGHWRGWLLTRVVPAAVAGGEHQSREYGRIFGVDVAPGAWEGKPLRVPEDAASRVRERLDAPGGGFIGMLPGAARGPSKRWPAERFAEAGRQLAAATGARVLVLGAPGEVEVCGRVAGGIGPAAVNLGGSTSLPELAAALAACRVVVANDSGGMHLAAAVGARVVALFGATDPAATGPLGSGHEVLAAAGVPRSRRIAKACVEASAALRSIAPEAVVAAGLRLWARAPAAR